MSTAAAIENVAILLCATFLAYQWDTAWPFLLMAFVNITSTKRSNNQ